MINENNCWFWSLKVFKLCFRIAERNFVGKKIKNKTKIDNVKSIISLLWTHKLLSFVLKKTYSWGCSHFRANFGLNLKFELKIVTPNYKLFPDWRICRWQGKLTCLETRFMVCSFSDKPELRNPTKPSKNFRTNPFVELTALYSILKFL